MRRQNQTYPASPGELMDQANILARGQLYDAPERDGRAMLRTWGEVVEAASEVWHQLPARSEHVGGFDVMNQLERSARTLRAESGGHRTDLDPTLQEIGGLLTRAADIIERSEINQRTTAWTRPQLQDAFAARVSLVHTVYLCAHSVSVGLADDALAERLDQRLRVHTVSAEQLRHRMAGVEELAAGYVAGQYPAAYDRRHRIPVDNDRLGAAVSAWDVHAQRFLTREPGTAGMATIAGGMFTAAAAARHLWAATAATGHVDEQRFQQELSPALETMVERWGAAQTLWKSLHHRREQGPDPAVGEATRELKAAMLELAWDDSRPATTEVVARRADLGDVVRVLHRFQATAAGVGQAFQSASATAQFVVDARAAHRLAKDGPGPKRRPDTEAEHAVVSPRAVANGSAVGLSQDLRPHIETVAGRAATSADGAMRASMAVSDPLTRPLTGHRRTVLNGPAALGRDQERMTVTTAQDRVEGPAR